MKPFKIFKIKPEEMINVRTLNDFYDYIERTVNSADNAQ